MRTPFLAAAGAAALAFAGAAPALANDTLVGLTSDDRLVTFSSDAPGVTSDPVAVTGLGAGEVLQGIDVRPATGAVYALAANGTAGTLYRLDPLSGVASDPVALSAPLGGSSFAVDFNPTVDRLRVISDTGLNFRINVDTGAVTDDADGNLADAGVDVVGAAYTNSFRGETVGATDTQLFDLDAASDDLLLQTPPNNGGLVAVDDLGVDIGATTAFDISPATNLGLAAVQVGDAATSSLLKIDLDGDINGTPSAAATVGAIGSGLVIKGLAVLRQVPRLHVLAADGLTLRTVDSTGPGQTGATVLPERDRVTITGLTAGDSLLGIDVRPATGVLYAFGSATDDQGVVYRLDAETGRATGRQLLTNAAGGAAVLATGNAFGVDFNPVPDRLRVVSDAGQNLRINVDTGVTTVDGTGTLGAADVIGAAYVNPFPGTTATALFDWDAASNPDQLLLQNPPNDGTTSIVGSTGVDTTSTALGYDIAPQDNAGFASTGDRLRRVTTPVGSPFQATAGNSEIVGTLPGEALGLAVLPSGLVGLTSTTYEVSEEADTVSIPVQRQGGDGVVTTVVTLGGVAKAVTFRQGEVLKQVTFDNTGRSDATDEAAESVPVTLTRGAGGFRLGTTAATLTVTDDDPATVTQTETTTTPGQTVTTTTPGPTTTVTRTETVQVTPAPAADRLAPTVLVAGRDRTIRALRSTGATYVYSCSETCTVRVQLLRGRTVIGTGTARRTGPGLGRVQVRLSSAGKRLLGRVQGRSASLVVRAVATDPAGNRSRALRVRVAARR